MASLEVADELPDGRVDELYLALELIARRGCSVQIATLDGLPIDRLDQLLPDAHRLEIHTEHVRNLGARRAEVRAAGDPVAHGVHFELIVALDVVEVPGPVAAVVVADGGAVHPGGGPDARQRNQVGIDLRTVEVIEVARHFGAGGAGDRGIDRMLIRPGGEAAGVVDHAENGVGAHEVPRIDRAAAMERVAYQALRIDRNRPAVELPVGRRAVVDAIELRLVEIIALLILRAGAVRLALDAVAVQDSIARVHRRWGQHAVVGYVVIDAHEFRRAAGDDRHQAGEGIRRLRCRSARV